MKILGIILYCFIGISSLGLTGITYYELKLAINDKCNIDNNYIKYLNNILDNFINLSIISLILIGMFILFLFG